MTEIYTANVQGATREECLRAAITEAKTYFGTEVELEADQINVERVPNPDLDDYDNAAWIFSAAITVKVRKQPGRVVGLR